MMRLQGGVKSIAMGGRPSTSQIQAIGGVKGSSDNTYDDIFQVSKPQPINSELSNKFINQIASLIVQKTAQNSTVSGASKYPTLAAISDLPQNRSIDNAMNTQDHILPDNFKDGVPAQYVNEPADCRMFYTPSMILDISKMWEAAADAAFNGKACVVGGISAGMAMKREPVAMQKRREMDRRAEMPKLKRAAVEARMALVQARSRPLNRFKGWAGLHGRGVPAFETL